jgi:16S rRNA (cytosine1402-N4)-methyltransferase
MMVRGAHPEGAPRGTVHHVPVLLPQVLAALAPAAGGRYIDGTYGAGGYADAILQAAPGATMLGLDRDPMAVAAGQAAVERNRGRLTLVEGRFGEVERIASEHGFVPADGVVLDIGVSSMQLDEASRGFSFRLGGPLDMRMGAEGPTAGDVVNRMEPGDLARVIAVLGEERKARAVAAAIARARSERAIVGTVELADIVAKAVGRRGAGEIHPATRTFQALRIFVNRELDELAEALAASERVLAAGGRLVVVAFHSLEDRIVKRFMTERSARAPGGSRHLPEAARREPTFELLTRGAVVPGAAEVDANPRARSARLRAARRTAAPPRGFDKRAIGVPELPVFPTGRA